MGQFLELVADIHDDLGISGSPPASVLNQFGLIDKLIKWISDADYEIQASWTDWEFLWSQHSEITTDGTAIYSPPADLGEWDRDSFWIDVNTPRALKLGVISYRDYRDGYRSGNRPNNRPSRVAILPNSDLALVSTPNDVYTLTADYWKKPTRLAANTDTSPIPDRFRRAIIGLAKMKYAESFGVPEVMESAKVEYDYWFSQLEAAQLPGQKERRMSNADLPATMVVRVG